MTTSAGPSTPMAIPDEDVRADRRLPRELRMPPPRNATPPRLSVAVCLLLLPHTLVGMGMVLAWMGQVTRVVAGVTVPGRVTDVQSRTNSKGHTTRTVTVAYTCDAEPRTEQFTLPSGMPTPAVGEMTAVRHLNGSFSTLADAQWSSVGGLTFGVLFWNGIMSVFWWQFLVRTLVARHLVRHGRAVMGRITSRRKAKGGWRVEYTWHPPGDRAYTAAIVCKVEPKGTDTPVLYGAQHPRFSLLWEWSDGAAFDLRRTSVSVTARQT